jgi:hypothetical protein
MVSVIPGDTIVLRYIVATCLRPVPARRAAAMLSLSTLPGMRLLSPSATLAQ